ncbi:MAG: TldD/PmbA family protein [bacterium JZ-2024 1]
MKDLSLWVMENAEKAGVPYVEFRGESSEYEEIYLKNGIPEKIQRNFSEGIGIRVLREGSWGFASSPVVGKRSAGAVLRQALQLAQEAQKTQNEPEKLDDSPLADSDYITPVQEDPFQVSLDEKIGILQEAHNQMKKAKNIVLTEGWLRCWRRKIWLQVTGSKPLYQEIIACGGGISAYASEGTEVQRRSFPASHGGNFHTAGWEFVRSLNIPEHAYAIAEEASALLSAPLTPQGDFPVVIGSAQMALQIHESIGHPTELDRIFGSEISFAGGSWVSPDSINSLPYGSEKLHIVGDSTYPGGLGTFGFDDEAVPSHSFPIIQHGILVNCLSSRETAWKIGKKSTACMRASNWNRIPLIRMVNVSMPPGNMSLEDLLADISYGIFLDVNKSWSIDDRRLNFQFATEYAREIRNGKLGTLLKNPIYSGITPQFWSRLLAVGDQSTCHLWGIPNCGKGEPVQTMYVGHGAPACLFRNLSVGVAK